MQTDFQGAIDLLVQYRQVAHEAVRSYGSVAKADRTLSPEARKIVADVYENFLKTNDTTNLQRAVRCRQIVATRHNWRALNSIEGTYVIRLSTRWIGVSSCTYLSIPMIPESLLRELWITSQEKARLAAEKAEAGEPPRTADEGAPEPASGASARKGRRGGRTKKTEAHAPA